MKRALFCLFVAALLCAAGCGPIRHETLPGDASRLPEDVTVAGQDLSRLTVGDARARLTAELPERTYRLRLPDQTVSMSAESLGISYDVDKALLLAINGEEANAVPLDVDTTVLLKALRAFAAQYSSAPSDAMVTFALGSAEPFVYTTERTGLTVDTDKLYQAVLRAVETGDTEVQVPYSERVPTVTEADVRAKNQCLGLYTTSFAKAPYNVKDRVFNIKKAAALIDGMVLEPGQTFDCNAALGDRNEENGWRMAAGIRNGQYVQEYGGGVCQVSSTLFNAVMMADLSIAERYPHSWPMGYVDIGRDATISTGGKNFCFVNTSSATITLSASVNEEEQTLTIALYGSPTLPDGQYISIASERTGMLPELPDEIRLDESLPYQTRVIEREGRQGRTARTYKEYYASDGTLLRRETVYEDTYRSISALVYVSTDLYMQSDE